ncbi:MAG TPA: urate oxidase [Longimicrobiales bacterium]
MARLGRNRYGKAGVRLVKVDRRQSQHQLRDMTVAVSLAGDFVEAHVTGDNAHILPTDTMKNSVYGLALEHLHGAAEDFGIFLARYFLTAAPIASARIKIREHLWRRIQVGASQHAHSFTHAGDEMRTSRITASAEGVEVRAGIRGLNLLKTTKSGFVGYIKDRFTTLPETTDRIFATSLNAEWIYDAGEHDYERLWQDARHAIEETFAEHDSLSVQHTLYAMGEQVLKRCPPVQRIRFALPNKHHLLVDLSRFGLENRNQIFVATKEPYGLIEGEIVR